MNNIPSANTSPLRKLYSILVRMVQWIIFSDIYITLGAVSFGYVNSRLLGLQTEHLTFLFLIVACATMFIYQFSRWTFFRDVPNDLSKDLLYYWMGKNHFVVNALMFLSILGGIICVFFVRIHVIFILMILGFISFLYNINIPIGKQKVLTLRKIPFAKIFMIALVWSSMAVILPWVEEKGLVWHLPTFNLFVLQFMFIFIITLPFDINDVEVDRVTGVKTIPISIGVSQAKFLLALLTFLYLILIWRWMEKNMQITIHLEIFCAGISILLSALLYKTIIRSHRAGKWQIMLWYDGSLILYFIIFVLSYWVTTKMV